MELSSKRMTLSRKHLLRAWPALLIFAGACGNDTTTTPTDTTTTPAAATVTATGSPANVTVTASTDSGYTWNGSFSVAIANTNASPITIKSITADLQQASAGIVITPAAGTDETFRFDVRAPGNRVDVNGTLSIPFTFYYTLPNGGREALVSLAFTVTTDAGASGSVTANVTLQ
jgi:hypothetical protein